MTKEEIKDAKDSLLLEESSREVFRRTLTTDDGVQVLTWILNECGLWVGDPEKVVPELHALGNRLLAKMGVVHEFNLFELTRKYTEAANDNDIAALRSKIHEEEKEK